METFTQPKIIGYRQLSEEEVALMNEGKALAEQCGAYITKLRAHKDCARREGGQQRRARTRPTLDQHRSYRLAARFHGRDSRHCATDKLLTPSTNTPQTCNSSATATL